jgi:opacity protein-like surface antigen
MKTLIAALVLLAIAAQASAQQLTDKERTEQMRRANRKITIGLVLMGAGALAAPLTALNRHTGDSGGPAMNASIGIMVLGSGVAWWGAMDRRRALQPQTSIGIGLGKAKSFRVRYTW